MSRGGLPGSETRFDPGSFFAPAGSARTLQVARVRAITSLCREHYRLTLSVERFGEAKPGQFVHLCPAATSLRGAETSSWVADLTVPMLRRAYSIAGLRRGADGVEIEVIFRVVGTATRWMESLREGAAVSVLGPQGNAFPISNSKPSAWLVSGGVGLPPMLWLAEALAQAGKNVVAFCGAQRRDLLALTLDPGIPPDAGAKSATLCAAEFARVGAGTVISTDDGSMGFRGYVGTAMQAYFEANSTAKKSLVIYTCGPEPMMRAVADFCTSSGIEGYLCMERNMACGTGMCQSCVVPIADAADSQGWSYRLCCTDGPIFSADQIVWALPA